MLSNPNADPKERALEEERFVQEAQLSAKLKHPHIVTVYEAGLLEGRQFLSMEMIEGQAFNDWRNAKSAASRFRSKAGSIHCGQSRISMIPIMISEPTATTTGQINGNSSSTAATAARPTRVLFRRAKRQPATPIRTTPFGPQQQSV